MLRMYLGGGAALWLALATSAWAQEALPAEAQSGGDAAAKSPAANAAIGQFDADNDGLLLGDELRRARDFMQALRGAMGNRDRDPGPPREGEGARPLRGRGDRGRRGGPPQADEAPPFEIGDGQRPPRPERPREGDGDEGRPPRQRPDQTMRLFREFDDNEDGQLNREEFTALMGALRERRGPGAVEGPGGDAVGPPARPGGRRGGEAGGPPRGRRGGEGFGAPRGDGQPGPPEGRGDGPRGPRRGGEGGRRPPRDGDVGQAFQPDVPREIA